MLDADAVGDILPDNVDKVEILRPASSGIYGSKGANGVVSIFLKKHSERKFKNYDISNVICKKLPGYTRPSEFYTPKYTRKRYVNEAMDIRPTIYWNHDLESGSDGKIDIKFCNNDIPGEKLIIVNGIGQNGELGSAVYEYKVRE